MDYRFRYNLDSYKRESRKAKLFGTMLAIVFIGIYIKLVKSIVEFNQFESGNRALSILVLVSIMLIILTVVTLIAPLYEGTKKNVKNITYGITGKYDFSAECIVRLEEEYFVIYNENIERKIFFDKRLIIFKIGKTFYINSGDFSMSIFINEETRGLYEELISRTKKKK